MIFIGNLLNTLSCESHPQNGEGEKEREGGGGRGRERERKRERGERERGVVPGGIKISMTDKE